MRQVAKTVGRPIRAKETRLRKGQKTPRRVLGSRKKPKSRVNNAKRGVLSCPKCRSTNLLWASGLPNLWSIWECRNCGYRGAFIVRSGEMAKKVRENYSKKTVKN